METCRGFELTLVEQPVSDFHHGLLDQLFVKKLARLHDSSDLARFLSRNRFDTMPNRRCTRRPVALSMSGRG
jgi:hypothetical protein